MLIGISYEEVEQAFGGNFDPAKGPEEEGIRLSQASPLLFEKYQFGWIERCEMPDIVNGRRYWVGVHITDVSNPLTESVAHSIVIDESGNVFDPNPQYGKFKSLARWRDAMTLPHQLGRVHTTLNLC